MTILRSEDLTPTALPLCGFKIENQLSAFFGKPPTVRIFGLVGRTRFLVFMRFILRLVGRFAAGESACMLLIVGRRSVKWPEGLAWLVGEPTVVNKA